MVLLQSFGLMLLIIVPVLALIVLFAWRYRATNTDARYEPDWDHSTALELVIWGFPLLIIICLGALTWMGTHLLDPYRPLDRIKEGQPVSMNAAAGVQPLVVDVVALDWKWLFIYPQYGVASVNDLAAPVDRPIDFHITASSVMNSFAIPALSGQIYAMPAMETRLHAVINTAGDYQGFSANYSGAGFSGMRFRFHGVSQAGFDAWVAKARAGGGQLGRGDYLDLEKPSENVPVRTYANVDPALFGAVLNLCVDPGKMCQNQMMAVDAKGGQGVASAQTVLPLEYDKFARRGAVLGPAPSYVAALCLPGRAQRPLLAPKAPTPQVGQAAPAGKPLRTAALGGDARE